METYYGRVQTPADAIRLFEACRIGMLPRVQRRLSEKERQGIRSGSVFVWDEKEAGMRRWTDGKSWSASRVSGSFLTYREMEGKRGNVNGQGPKRNTGKTPDSGRGSEDDLDDPEPDGYRYKPDGLMKQSFSITTSAGQHLHLISYFARGAAGNDLPTPSNDSQFRTVAVPAKGLYPESSLHDTQIPLNTKEPMQHPSLYGHYTHHGQPSHHGPPHPGLSGQPHPGHPHPGHQPHPGHPPHPGHSAHPSFQGYSGHHQPPHQAPSWPPSHEGTPLYGHPHYGTQASLPPPQHQYPPNGHTAPQNPSYDPRRPPQYNRMVLPLPEPSGRPPRTLAPLRPPHTPPDLQQALPHPPPHLPRSPHMDQVPRIPPIDSPRSLQLQEQAREAAARIDPRAGLGGQQGPLPALTFAGPPPQYPAGHPLGGAPARTPPPRTLSLSPRSAHSDAKTVQPPSASTTASLSVLLHPTPANSEPSSANTVGSATGSPAAVDGIASSSDNMMGKRPLDNRTLDNRALGMLDKNFFD